MRGYREQRTASAPQTYVDTSPSRPLIDGLDYARDNHCLVVIEGHSGRGKSAGAKAWTEANLHRARYITLSSPLNRSTFFGSVAAALGLEFAESLSSARLQARIESHLRQTKFMLVIDEAQNVWPAGYKINHDPELVEWITNACCNQGIAVGLVATKGFSIQRARVEKQVRWNSEQLRRRVDEGQHIVLPDTPTVADLGAYAIHMAPEATAGMIKILVGDALSCEG